MTDLQALIVKQGYCTPDQYLALYGWEWDGVAEYAWPSPKRGYKIKPHPASKGTLGKPGGKPNPLSERQRQPWIAQGVSQATYYRLKADEAKWTSVLAPLPFTPANREAYTHFLIVSRLLGCPVDELWGRYVRLQVGAQSS